jgi:hypothetical protein
MPAFRRGEKLMGRLRKAGVHVRRGVRRSPVRPLAGTKPPLR